MAMSTRNPLVPICGLVFVMSFLGNYVSNGTQTDFQCLQLIKNSVIDPNKYLNTSWDFTNTTEGSICRFIGIECWHPDESRVLNIKLQDMGLKGSFPSGFVKCTSLTGLYLSGNEFNGSIPSNISTIVPFVTTLDLSDNRFSGVIPLNLSNCSFLNTLDLSHNRFSGQIPLQLGQLGRIKQFSVAYNSNLTGQVPQFSYNISEDSYANNPGLCGTPLPLCMGPPKKSNNGVIAGAVAGAFVVVITLMGIGMYHTSKRAAVRKKQDDPEGNRWAKSMKGTKACKVSMFEKEVSEMSLSDLMKATNSFSNTNIIGTGSKGVMYKATLPDGTHLMVKRLQDSQRSEKEFLSEMKTLGSVNHRNLLPLLGFCMAKNERFLVYRYMANGNLFDELHPVDPEAKPPMEWPLRLKIAIGGARGLAWLHHSCNPRIIHRNISSKCILLDEEFEPQLSEFGLARLMNPVDTHLSTFVNGEFGDLGYVAPEYLRTLTATPKGDVYSFGVVLLEIITNERSTHVDNAPESFKGSLVEWISHLSSTSQVRSAIHKSLVGLGFDEELNQFLKVACNCVNPTPKERPSMFEVLQFLRAIGERYHFTADDDLVMPSDMGDADFPDELIVARESKDFK